jgi:hypothetical protein
MSINLLLGRTGPVWHRRYDAQAILTDDAAVGRVRYVLANPQKARLVRHVDEWPGYVALAGKGDDARHTEWLDWTAWHRAHCPEDRAQFRREGVVRLHQLPSLSGRTDDNYVRDILDGIEPLGANERVLGLEKVLDTDFDDRPDRPKRARRPYAFGDTDAVRAYLERCSAAYAAYAERSERLRRGEWVPDWPDGMYAPGISRAA